MRTFGAIAFNNRCVSAFLPIYFLLLILNKLIELHWYWSDDTMTFLVTQPQCTQNVRLRSKMFKSSRRRYFIKKAALFSIFTWEHLCWILFFLMKLHTFKLATLLKRDCNTGVFLWTFWNQQNTYFEEHIRTAAFGCHINAILTFYLGGLFIPHSWRSVLRNI